MERKRRGKQSWDVWLPTLWILYCATRPITYWFGTGTVISDAGYNVESGNPLERITLSIMITAAMVILANKKVDWRQVFHDNLWLMVLFGYMFVSIVWSEFPFVSLKRWIRTAGTVLIALVLLTSARPLEALESVFIKTAYILVPISVVLVKYFQEYGVTYNKWSHIAMWQGVTLTKNTLGVLCMVSVLFLVWSMIRRWRGSEPRTGRLVWLADVIVIAQALWLLRGPGGAYSASSVGALILGLGTFLVLYCTKGIEKRLDRLVILGLTASGLIILLGQILDFSPLALATSLVGRDPTLTGRTDDIWAPLFKIALENPVLGLGFGGFWVRPVADVDVNEAHNGYLEVFIQLGVFGVLLLLALIVSFYWKAKREFAKNKDWGTLRLAILIIAVLHNFTETSWIGDVMLLWNLFVCLAIVHPRSVLGEEERMGDPAYA